MNPADPNMVAMTLPDRFNREQRTKMAKRKAIKPRAYRDRADGGYDVLHPTKGWRAFTPRRIAAEGSTLAKKVGQLPWWSGIKAFEERVARG